MKPYPFSFKTSPSRPVQSYMIAQIFGLLLGRSRVNRLRQLVNVRKYNRLTEAVKYVTRYEDHFGSEDPVHSFLLIGNDARAGSFLWRYTDVHMRGLPEKIVVVSVEPTDQTHVENIKLRIHFTDGWCCFSDVLLYRDSDPWFDPTELVSWSWSRCEQMSDV